MAEPLNISVIERQLCRERLQSPGEYGWLEESYRNPLPFWQALRETQASMLSWPVKSIPFGNYDFYHDIVVRNQRNTAPAFCWHDSLLGWREISFEQLGALATRKEAVWLGAGVQPGQKVCIVLPLGVQYVVSLLTALKIGLTISCLPPQGNLFLRNRLEALSPDFISTDEMYLSMVSAWREKILPEESAAGAAKVDSEHSHTYPSGSVVRLSFDPSRETPHLPVEVSSDTSYLCPLRDGIIALGIRPGDILAAPGFHFLESQPGLLLACLLNGCTYLHLESDDISDNPELLIEHPIRVMGVSRKVRDTLLQKRVKFKKPLYYWFRNPAEALDLELWQQFIEISGLEKVYNGNVKYDATLGGCSLFSTKRQGQAHLQVLPSAGVPWGLADPASGEIDSVADFGAFSPVSPGSENGGSTSAASILAKSAREWLFVGSRVSGRTGRTYPTGEVLASIHGFPHCSLSSIVEVPRFAGGADPAFVLLLFLGGKTGPDQAAARKEILTAVLREMGNEFLPDRIHFFPLYPRREGDGNVDHHWCRDQYLTGSLFRKSREETYRLLAQLREHLV
jgi:hypothetical protein